MNTTAAGNMAEQAVAEELVRRGYEVLSMNWKTRVAEIDVVARKNGIVFFVEVKYRRSLAHGDGFSYITATKLQHMQRAAEAWVQQQGWSGPYELLAASVVGVTDSKTIELCEIY